MEAPPPFIEVRGTCDLRCAWCNAEGTPPTDAANELARAGEALESLAAAGHVAVGLGLLHSEPTTHPALADIVGRARSLGFRTIHLATSGMVISERKELSALRERGLTGVSLTLVGGEGELTDTLLGLPGSSKRKLAAVENVIEAGLETHVSLALLRPTLGELAGVAKDLVQRFEALRDPGAVHASLLDTVEHMAPERFEALWPRYDEILWAMARLREELPVVPLHARYLPECVRDAVGGASPLSGRDARPVDASRASARCGACQEATCAGLEPAYVRHHEPLGLPAPLLPKAPPTADRAALEKLLRPPPPYGGDAEMAQAASVLSKLASSGRTLGGFALSDVRATGREAVALLQGPAGQRLSVRVAPRCLAARCFASSDRFAISYGAGAQSPDDAGQVAMGALLELLERAVR